MFVRVSLSVLLSAHLKRLSFLSKACFFYRGQTKACFIKLVTIDGKSKHKVKSSKVLNMIQLISTPHTSVSEGFSKHRPSGPMFL